MEHRPAADQAFLSILFVAVACFLLGYQATISQVVLIREFLVVLFGNELCLGVIFSCWFVGIGLGAWSASRLVDKSKDPLSVFVLAELSLPLMLTGLLPLIRITRSWAGAPAGELIPFFKLVVATGLMVIPISVLIGFAFPFACRSMRLVRPIPDTASTEPQNIGWVYVLESSGSLAGGVLFTFVLVQHFNSFAIAFISIVVVSAGLLLLVLSAHARIRQSAAVPLLCLIAFCAGTSMLLLDVPEKLDAATVLARWRSMGQRLDLVASRDSKYQNLTVGVQEEQYSLFANGQYTFSFPDPYSSAQEANLFMCEHPDPRQVLLVGGTPGVLGEILRHPVTRVDYLEIDPEVLTIITPFLSASESESLRDPRVNVVHEDGRHFIKRNRGQRLYDLAIIDVPDPSTAMLNRFYTREFFSEVKDVLQPGGVVVTGISSSSTYFGEEIQSFSGSLFATLRDRFAYLAIAPGETNYFFVSDSPNVVTDDAELLAQRYDNRGIESDYFSKYVFSSIFWPERVRFTRESFEKAENLRVNTDNTPVTYFFNLVLWSRYSGGRFGPLLLTLSGMRFGRLILIIVGVFALGSVPLFARRGGTESVGRPLALVAVGTTGAAAMAFDLIALYAYQNAYGYLYQEIGLVVALFMTGLALGSVLATARLVKSPADSAVLLLALEIIIGAFALALPKLLQISGAAPTFAGGKLCFLTVVVAAGFITGAEFPVANAVFMHAGGTMGRSAALTDSTDHIGAALGAFLTGVFLIPIFGALRTCAFVSALNFLSAALIASWLIRKSPSTRH
jgi:spermidine synthase